MTCRPSDLDDIEQTMRLAEGVADALGLAIGRGDLTDDQARQLPATSPDASGAGWTP